jgi:hypothetical protein
MLFLLVYYVYHLLLGLIVCIPFNFDHVVAANLQMLEDNSSLVISLFLHSLNSVVSFL